MMLLHLQITRVNSVLIAAPLAFQDHNVALVISIINAPTVWTLNCVSAPMDSTMIPAIKHVNLVQLTA
jgi:hypothetical protein